MGGGLRVVFAQAAAAPRICAAGRGKPLRAL
jgi:hypothetical protein